MNLKGDTFFDRIKQKFLLKSLNKELRRKTGNYNIYLEREAPIEQIDIGQYTYGSIYALFFDDCSKLEIGSFCSIAPRVAFMVSADHYTNHISSYPFKVKVMGEKQEGFSKGDIIVDDDVWIGYGATILSGVHIGQGAVIAAGSVVTKDVPPYAVVGGVPAKVIKYRFEQDMIDELLKIDYSRLSKEQIEKHIDELYVDMKDIRQLNWMPKRDEK